MREGRPMSLARRLAALTVVVFAVAAAPAAAAVTVDPTTGDFGTVPSIGAFATKSFVVTNDSDAPLDLVGGGVALVDVPGLNTLPGGFALQQPAPSTSCTLVTSLAAHATCTVDVRFTPTQPGVFQAEFLILTGAGPQGFTFVTGRGSEILASPTTLDFGQEPVGSLGAPRSVSMQVFAALTPTVRVVGADQDDFLITTDGCTGVLITSPPFCTIHIRFSPTAQGARTATLTVTSGKSVATTALSGTGGTGTTGATGPTGPIGPQGTTGATGPTGPIG